MQHFRVVEVGQRRGAGVKMIAVPKRAELDATVSVIPGIPADARGDGGTCEGSDDAGGEDTGATVAEPSELLSLLPLSPGDTIGRYVLRTPLGQGGMGVVWEADDPKLQRRVALKLVVSGERSHGERLVREARAQARLSHPNVLPIYDVGVDHARPGRSEVFIAMELAPGGTLRHWTSAPHTWDEILRAYIEAGRGLAAAHAAGVVHRDFKPANVLIGEDGRPRVADFGLALAGQASTSELSVAEELDPPTPRPGATGPVVHVVAERLTATGTVMGTLEYMAPEQHDRRSVDGRADQFAYCVALFGALYGRRPFVADDPIELAALKARHELPEPTGARAKAIPRSVHAAIVRGLSPQPHLRFGTMDALLSVLAAGLPRGRRLGPWIVIGGSALVATAVWGATALPNAPGCAGRGDTLYDDDVRTDLERAFEALALPRAAATWPRVDARLEQFAERWGQTRQQACELSASERPAAEGGDEAGHASNVARVDVAMACLEGHRHGLQALVEGLQSGLSSEQSDEAAATLDGAVQAAMELPDPSTCLATKHAGATDAGPRHQRALSRSKSLRATHRPQDALAEVEVALAEAETRQHTLALAAALLERALCREMLGQVDASQQDFERAYFIAAEEGDDALAGAAALDFATSLADRSADIATAQRWLEHARAAVDRIEDEELAADVLMTETFVAIHAGDAKASVSAGEHALATIEALRGEEHLDVAGALNDLAYAYTLSGQHDQAIAALMRARSIYEPLFGHGHPELVNVYTNLGLAEYRMGRFADAKQSLDTALRIRRAIVDGDDPRIAALLGNLGLVHIEMGKFDDALALHQQSRAMRQALYGDTHPLVAAAWLNLGLLHYREHRLAEAEAAFSKSLDAYVASVGPTHPDTARVAHNLGLVLRDTDRVDEAIVQLETARAGFASANQRDLEGMATMELGATLVVAERPEQGLAMLAEALPILQETTGEDGFYVAMLLRYRGLGHKAQAELGAARRDLARCVELAVRTVGEEHFLVADCREDLAELDSATAPDAP